MYYLIFLFRILTGFLIRLCMCTFVSGGRTSAGQDHLQRVVRGQGRLQGVHLAHVGPRRLRPWVHRLRPHLGKVHAHHLPGDENIKYPAVFMALGGEGRKARKLGQYIYIYI